MYQSREPGATDMSNRFGPSTVCPECDADLDGGEICACNEEERNFQEMMQENEDE